MFNNFRTPEPTGAPPEIKLFMLHRMNFLQSHNRLIIWFLEKAWKPHPGNLHPCRRHHLRQPNQVPWKPLIAIPGDELRMPPGMGSMESEALSDLAKAVVILHQLPLG